MNPSGRKKKRITYILSLVLFLVAVGTGAIILKVWRSDAKTPAVPSAAVRLGDFVDYVELRGEVSVRSSSVISAPYDAGDLQILKLARSGTHVQKGDVVVEFDPTSLQRAAEQSRSSLKQVEAEMARANAQQRLAEEKIKTEVISAQFDLERARLDASTRDVIPAIESEKNVLALEKAEQKLRELNSRMESRRIALEAKKNLIDLEDAKRRYEQLQRDAQSSKSSDAADLAVQNVARMKAQMGMKLAQQNIENMTWKSPTDGVVVLGQNLESLMSSSGSIRIYSGMEIPEFREGDQVYPGRLVAQIQGTSELEIASKVLETDRGNLDAGQPVDIWMDSTPLKQYSGRIKSLATSASDASSADTTSDYLEALSVRSFDAVFEVDGKGDQFYMGVSVRLVIKGKVMADVLSIPRQALFQKDSRPVVYLPRGEGLEAREIRIKYLTESRAVIDGLEERSEVALVNPDLQKSKSGAKTGALASLLGGSSQ